MLKYGAILDVKDTDGNTSLHLAVRNNNFRWASNLIKHGASIQTKNKKGYGLLHSASLAQTGIETWSFYDESRDNPFIQSLLKNKINVNAKDQEGYTPLHFFTAMNNYEVVAMLLDHGANVQVTSKEGWTPLHFASDKKMIALLLRHGASIKVKNNRGWIPLHVAYLIGHSGAISAFIEAGSAKNAKTDEGLIPSDLSKAKTNLWLSNLMVKLIIKSLEKNFAIGFSRRSMAKEIEKMRKSAKDQWDLVKKLKDHQ